MTRRVVITGLGIVSSVGNTIQDFSESLRGGLSGIQHMPIMEELKFGCHVAGIPHGVDEIAQRTFDEDDLLAMNSSHRYGCVAAVDAWLDAGFARPKLDDDEVDWDCGAIIGTGVGGLDTVGEKVVPLTNSGRVRRLGSTIVEQVMGSGVSARIAGLFALGNQVTSNSSACSSGTEAIIMGLERIRSGRAKRMLCGGVEGTSHYSWAGFDAMRVLSRRFNDDPHAASRPMSASAAGFVPGAGAGMLLLEDLESAVERGAGIHGEVLGGWVNCGGHRMGGSMTAPNPVSVQRCVRSALANAGIGIHEIDAINGHLTATGAEAREVLSWADALDCEPGELPPITSTKSMIGHSLGAAGAIESIACIAMLKGGIVHPSINCEDVHPEIEAHKTSIPHTCRDMPELQTIIKAGFGFGDVNACVVLKKWINK
ncbi:MAG: beta-ketoacyl-[acyl-carrier-protein] synthase family protein [Thermoanaerobaculales bacterium]|nr:beta-ketoacyl-[acyl-carrier-protein] synthase family protein [Thermoanaerobaculales bacterium]